METGHLEKTIKTLHSVEKYVRKGWCQKAFAMDSNRLPVDAIAQSAVQWCLSGAMHRALFDLEGETYKRESEVYRYVDVSLLLAVKREADENLSVSKWNDQKGRTVEEVLKVLESAKDIALDFVPQEDE